MLGNISFPIAVQLHPVTPKCPNERPPTAACPASELAAGRDAAGEGLTMTLEAHIPPGPIADKWDEHKFSIKLVNPANKRRFHVLVVGTGLAGASAAATSPSSATR